MAGPVECGGPGHRGAFGGRESWDGVTDRACTIGRADEQTVAGALTGPNSARIAEVQKPLIYAAVVIIVEAVAVFRGLAFHFFMVCESVAVVVDPVKATRGSRRSLGALLDGPSGHFALRPQSVFGAPLRTRRETGAAPTS